MKKLILLLLFIPLVSFGQDEKAFIITNNNPDNQQDLGYDIMDTFVLKNGNTLTLASVDRDYRTANSECQCEEYQFGKVFWIFEKDIDNKIVNQRCYKEDDFGFMDNLWFNCASYITKIFYVGDDVVFHFLEATKAQTAFLDTYTKLADNTSGSSLLVKFNLSNFEFYEPEPFYIGGESGLMVIDKLFYINDYYPVSLYGSTAFSSSPEGMVNSLISNGYQNLVMGNINSDYRVQYRGKQLIKEIFDGNSDEMILDYKQDSKNSLTFLVVSNSLDGLYSDGEDYKTSLYIIKATFTTSNSKTTVNYSVTKSELQIPRNIDLQFQEYNVFVDNNNSFVVNVKDDEVEGAVGYSGDTDIYNKLYFLNDDGSFKSINLDNDFGLEFVDTCSVDRKYAIAYSGAADKSINNNSRGYWSSDHERYIGHHLIDIAFSDNIFMTLESNSLKYKDEGSGWKDYSIVKVLKTFDYNGNLLSRNVVFVSKINKNQAGEITV